MDPTGELPDESFRSVTPRQWWIYFDLVQPRTSHELATRSGLVESSIRTHLRALRKLGVVTSFNSESGTLRAARVVDLTEPQNRAALRKLDRLDGPRPAGAPSVLPPAHSSTTGSATGAPAHPARAGSIDRRGLLVAGACLTLVATLATVIAFTRPDTDDVAADRTPLTYQPDPLVPPKGAEESSPANSQSSEARHPRHTTAVTPKPRGVYLPGSYGDYRVSKGMVGLVTSAAAIYGYTIDRDEQGATAVAVIICERIAYEGWTWDEQIADDIDVGAPPADARGFVDFLRDRFCPALRT